MNDPVMLVFPCEEVEAQNVAPLLRRFAPDKLPRGRDLAAMMSTFHFAVHGYDDDPHEVYAIAAVRGYYQSCTASGRMRSSSATSAGSRL